jgi:hypothetical protein
MNEVLAAILKGNPLPLVLHPLCGNERNDARPVDDNPRSDHSEGDHHFRPDARHDVWVSGAGSRHARLLRLERDRDDHLYLGSRL